jgi:hypothetical protein
LRCKERGKKKKKNGEVLENVEDIWLLNQVFCTKINKRKERGEERGKRNKDLAGRGEQRCANCCLSSSDISKCAFPFESDDTEREKIRKKKKEKYE